MLAAHTIPWHRRASVWLGLGINPASISLGGGLATQLPRDTLLWLIPLASILLILVTVCQGLIGRRHRQPLAKIASTTFGRWAGILNLGMVIGMVGWGGFQGGVSGASAAQLINQPDWVGALLIIGTLFVLSQLGVNRWAFLVWLTTSAAIALTIFALATIDLTPTQVVPNSGRSLPLWIWAVSTIFAYSTLFSMRNADFTWDMASDADVIKANLCMLFPFVFSVGAGAMLFYATGNWNIADVLTQSQSAALGHIFLILAVVSPLLSGFYSGTLALVSISPLKERQATLLICGLGYLLAATRFDQLLIPFLGALGASLGPALAVMLLSYGLPSRPSTAAACLAWLAGASAATLMQIGGQSLYIFSGAVTSLVVLVGFWAADIYQLKPLRR